MSSRSVKAEAAARALASLAAISPEEDAAITEAARSDSDNPPLTEGELANFRPILPEHLDAVLRVRGQRGPGRKPAKTQVTLRIDPDVLAAFKREGPGWQRRINEALRAAVLPKKRRA